MTSTLNAMEIFCYEIDCQCDVVSGVVYCAEKYPDTVSSILGIRPAEQKIPSHRVQSTARRCNGKDLARDPIRREMIPVLILQVVGHHDGITLVVAVRNNNIHLLDIGQICLRHVNLLSSIVHPEWNLSRDPRVLYGIY